GAGDGLAAGNPLDHAALHGPASLNRELISTNIVTIKSDIINPLLDSTAPVAALCDKIKKALAERGK
ncbi:MAG: hypothetical protein ACXU7X_06205, partial [Croceibacterium sp.]